VKKRCGYRAIWLFFLFGYNTQFLPSDKNNLGASSPAWMLFHYSEKIPLSWLGKESFKKAKVIKKRDLTLTSYWYQKIVWKCQDGKWVKPNFTTTRHPLNLPSVCPLELRWGEVICDCCCRCCCCDLDRLKRRHNRGWTGGVVWPMVTRYPSVEILMPKREDRRKLSPQTDRKISEKPLSKDKLKLKYIPCRVGEILQVDNHKRLWNLIHRVAFRLPRQRTLSTSRSIPN